LGALDGKVAIVTGAGRGICRAVAEAYAASGAAVACLSDVADEVAGVERSIREAGGRALAAPVDVTDMAAVEAAVETSVRAFGGLDILFVGHGANTALGLVEETDPEAWRKTIAINLFGAYHCARASIPHLKARGAGKIIVIGSGHSHQGAAMTSAYSAAKSGMWGFVQSMAAELISFNISVNELIPGNVNTRLYREALEQVRGMNAQNAVQPSTLRPSEWLKEPEDVAPLAVMLASFPDVGPTAQSYSLMRRL